MTTQGGRFVQSSAPPGVINLGLGQPSPRLLPLAEIGRAATQQLARGGDPLVLQYGALRGYAEFRISLARLLSAEYGHEVAADQLMVTGGISSALALVAEVLAEPGATVVCEDPTYFLARGVFETLGLRVRGVPVDGGGLQIEALEALLAQGLRPAFVYCIPAFQNPCGVSLEPRRARRLLELAVAHDFWIVADEPYVMLYWDQRGPQMGGECPGSLVRHDFAGERVLSLGSFSKILAPGLRLGWAHGAPSLIERLAGHGSLRSGGCLNPVMANIVHHTLDSGFLTEHIAGLRRVLGDRCRALTQALRERIPGATMHEPRGGYFCWLDLGEGRDAQELLEGAETLSFLPGPRCAVERDLARFVRLSFSFYEAEELVEGVERLATLLG